jgi:NAD(P)H-nitrite reductase large subunit
MHYVVIGNGVAGINAANIIRRRDKGADITVISKESDHFFSRTALMYVFCGQLNARDVEPFQRDHYKRMNFKRVRDEVVDLDSNKKSLKMKSGESIFYDRLLIASGSLPRMVGWPGQDLDGVGNFVTWQNLEWMMEHARTTKKAVIVGGGLIGIEVTEVLNLAGIETTFVIREDFFWPIAFDKNEGDMITEHMNHHGVKVLLKTECQEVLGQNGKVVGIKTNNNETIDSDIVVFTIGVVPQTDWLQNSGLEIGKMGGIVVNEFLQTNLPEIWAAGDCTEVIWFNNVRRPEQLWYTSRDQGKIAGYNLAGDKRIYKRATFYNSAKFFNLEYTTAGYVNFNFDGEQNWYQREPGTEYSERITYLPDKTVIGFNMIGRRWDHRVMVNWIDQKRTIDFVLENLGDALFDEEFMSKFRILEKA